MEITVLKNLVFLFLSFTRKFWNISSSNLKKIKHWAVYSLGGLFFEEILEFKGVIIEKLKEASL